MQQRDWVAAQTSIAALLARGVALIRMKTTRRMPQAPRLDPDQQAKLKRLFQEACMQCHPDRVTDTDKAQAGALFIQVRAAYQQGDLETLRRLHGQLKSSRPFADPATVFSTSDIPLPSDTGAS